MTAPLSMKEKKEKKELLNKTFMKDIQGDVMLKKHHLPWINVNQEDNFGFTALYWAISHGNMHNLKLLIEHGATLQVTTTMNALFYAIDCDNLEVLKYFIERGIDKNMTRTSNTGQRYTLLEHATRINRKVIVEYLR